MASYFIVLKLLLNPGIGSRAPLKISGIECLIIKILRYSTSINSVLNHSIYIEAAPLKTDGMQAEATPTPNSQAG